MSFNWYSRQRFISPERKRLTKDEQEILDNNKLIYIDYKQKINIINMTVFESKGYLFEMLKNFKLCDFTLLENDNSLTIKIHGFVAIKDWLKFFDDLEEISTYF